MADTKTADEWKKVAADARAQVPKAIGQFEAYKAARDDAFRRKEQSSKNLESFLAANPDAGTIGTPANAQAKALRQEVNAAAAEVRQLEAARNAAGEKIQDLNRTVENAEREAEKAAAAPPGTIENPVTSVNTPPPDEVAGLGELGINEDLIPKPPADIAADDPTLGLLGQNPDVPSDAALGELGINTAPQPTQSGVKQAQSSGNEPRFKAFPEARDYRVRVSLAPSASYLYKDPAIKKEDILYPLTATGGVVYPYTPTIVMNYTAQYAATDLIHTNYKLYNYIGSNVEPINIVGDFTAQDVNEANYVLAVIHFYRSVTKMFYGQDQNRGVPPPLVYLSGHGEYGFDNHAMVVTSFSFTWPNDVDYINCGPNYNVAAVLNNPQQQSYNQSATANRLSRSGLQPGGIVKPPTFGIPTNTLRDITRIPTRLQITISANPIVTRDNISNNFSLKEYATGKLLRGSKTKMGGGFW